MIGLNFILFWAGGKLSYLRYLTFKSLRHFHPNSTITFYKIHEFNKHIHSWGKEMQDFEGENIGGDYSKELSQLGVEIINIRCVGSPNYCPILQTDMGRWVALRDEGGFYLDTDQIIMNTFADLPLDKEFIYSRYEEPQCGDYLPVGVLGLEKGSSIADIVLDTISRRYNPMDYNSSGPYMMRDAIKRVDLSRSFNAPSHYFYPIHTSKDVDKLYYGDFVLGLHHKRSFACHWYGGNTKSQAFNDGYTEEFAKTSNDSLSVFLRGKKII